MGNEQGKSEIRPQLIQTQLNSSQQNLQQKGVYHKNVNAMKPGATIFLPESATGADLKTTEIQDYNNYIRVKPPVQTVNLRESRGSDYSKQVASKQIDQNMLGITQDYKAAHKRHFQLKIDHINGVSRQAQIIAFDYDKKLSHYHQKPSVTPQNAITNK